MTERERKRENYGIKGHEFEKEYTATEGVK